MFRPILVTPPAGLPVSLAEVKPQVIVTHDEDDQLLENYIRAATAHLDGLRGVLGRAILNQTWAVQQSDWESDFVLPVPDVTSVAVSYTDADGAEQTFASTRLTEVGGGTQVNLTGDLPTLESDNAAPIRVQFTTGFGATPDDVPWALKVAIMQMVDQMYNHRLGEPKIGPMLAALIAPYRWVSM